MHECVQSEYKEQREGERRAKKMVRIKLFPMLLYCFFILAAMFYAYVRILFGMGGLVTGLKVYSYIVLVIELLGALNMVFYGCWLFAKPVNDDVFPRVDSSTVRRLLRLCHACHTCMPHMHASRVHLGLTMHPHLRSRWYHRDSLSRSPECPRETPERAPVALRQCIPLCGRTGLGRRPAAVNVPHPHAPSRVRMIQHV